MSLLAFNSKGNYLASVGLDGENTLVVYEWKKKNMILSTPTDKRRILCICFVTLVDKTDDDGKGGGDGGPSYMVATGGVDHMRFWWARGQNVKSQRGLWGREKPQDILCISALSPGKCLLGSVKGDLFIWKNFKLWEKADRDSNPHFAVKSPIQAMWTYQEESGMGEEDLSSFTCLTGDKLGNIAVWKVVETDLLHRPSGVILQCVHHFNVASLDPPPTDVSVRSVCEREGVMLIGTQGSEVYEVPFNIFLQRGGKQEFQTSVLCKESKLHISGHSKGELWGLTCHPTQPLFFTSGDDCTVRSWELPSHKRISSRVIEGKGRALAVNQKGTHLAVG
mgnify:CR=1 FL=1